MTAVKWIAVIYLIIGFALASATDPGQVWVCPAPGTPHGTTVGNVKRSEDCAPTISGSEKAVHYALVIAAWPVLFAGKAAE
ncbi:MAG: hypothetical protein H0U53_10370 [Actinobacteria bacterium]|nr:hypothetical protein [Actinomycetota bacterium]